MARATDRRVVMALIGDIGVSEMNTLEADHLVAKRIYDRVQSWVVESSNHRVIALYMDEPAVPETDDKRFFRELAEAAGEGGLFSNNPAEMVTAILEGALAD